MLYMTEHLIEAIGINFKRSKLYAAKTNGRSLSISRFLIGTEILIVPVGIFLDCIAKFWQWQEVPVMVHEFIPMENTSDYFESYPFEFQKLDRLPDLNFQIHYENLLNKFQTMNYRSISEAFEEAIKSLDSIPQHYCMLRHLLESGLRCSNLAETHVKVAHEMSVITPHWFCLYLIFTHILPLKLAVYLDRKAFEIQKNNVPIIYQDVPPIPPFPDQY